MSVLENETARSIARAFLISLCMSALMILVAFGLMYIFAGNSLPVSAAISLALFAVIFVVSVVLLDRIGVGQASSLAGSAAISMGFTIFILSAVCGIFYLKQGFSGIETDSLIAGCAICMIVSVVINRLTIKA